MKGVYQLFCKHKEENLEVRTITYNTETITTTVEHFEIVCLKCGKVILPRKYFTKYWKGQYFRRRVN